MAVFTALLSLPPRALPLLARVALKLPRRAA